MTAVPATLPELSKVFRDNKFSALGLLCACLLATCASSKAALISVTNLNSSGNGAYALVDSTGAVLADPPGKIFVGGFSGTYADDAAIAAAFNSNFSALASDFVSVLSLDVEEDGFSTPVDRVHRTTTPNVDATAAHGRNVAIWLTTSGTINDTNAEHLIFWTTQVFSPDPVPPPDLPENSYSVNIRPTAAPDGRLAVGGLGNFQHDFMLPGGPGLEDAYNTVAVPEPRTIWTLLGVSILGMLFRKKLQLRREAEES